jgi:oligopeptide transport system ATP-binding protein
MSSDESDVVLKVENLRAFYTSRKGLVRAVNGVNFEVRRGEVFGLFGESGSGKTSIALAILGLFDDISRHYASTSSSEENKRLWDLRDKAKDKASASAEIGEDLPGVEGDIWFKGENLVAMDEKEHRKLRGDRITYVPQGTTKSLNPYSNIAEQTAEPLYVHDEDGRLSEKGVLRRVLKALDLMELGDALLRKDMKPREFSVGEDQRVLIAMALITLPDLLIADEPTTAVDMAIQNRILEAIHLARDELGLAMLLISNNQTTINATCDRIAVMTAGYIVEMGSTKRVLGTPGHPFTRAFIMSNPSMEAIRKIREKGLRIRGIPGQPPDNTQPIVACPFSERCEFVIDKCRQVRPELREVDDDYWVMCHRYDELPPW